LTEPTQTSVTLPLHALKLVAVQPNETASPEARLLRVFALIATSQGSQAIEEARGLTQEFPNFRLAQLAYADLLSAHSSPRPSLDAMPAGLRQERPRSLEELADEAQVRVSATMRKPPVGTVPAQFVFLSPAVRYAIAVDISLSRVYVLENTPDGLLVKRDYYASVGKLGAAKNSEGDLKTPLGVYFVTRRVDGARLSQLHGAAAFTLNYPNQYDQLRGRTGTGIWVHGVEPSQFNRARLATDGCVALSNSDLLDLAQFVDRQSTPVVIAEQLEWVQPAQLQRRQANFLQTMESWREARKSANLELLQHFYSSTQRTPGQVAGAWPDSSRNDRANVAARAQQLENLSVLAWHDSDDLMIVTFLESDERDARGRLKRQYWMQQAGLWSIIYEGTIG
jgi:murein L,D-transpeptidase YafK